MRQSHDSSDCDCAWLWLQLRAQLLATSLQCQRQRLRLCLCPWDGRPAGDSYSISEMLSCRGNTDNTGKWEKGPGITLVLRVFPWSCVGSEARFRYRQISYRRMLGRRKMVCFVDVGLFNAICPLTELFKFRVGFNRASGFGSVGSGRRPLTI